MKLSKIKHYFEVKLGKTLQGEQKRNDEVLLPYVSTSNIGVENSSKELKSMWFSPGEIKKYSIRKGDLLVVEGGDIGKSFIWEGHEPVGFQNHVFRMKSKSGGCPVFANFWLKHLKESGYFTSLSDKVTLATLPTETLKNTPFPVLPVDDQEKIGAFLNEETARIDALIEKNERLITLCGEKLRAEIDSVTKQAPGKVRVRMSKVCDYIPGKHLGVGSTTTEPGDVRYLRTADLYEDMSFEKAPLWVSEPDDTELAAETDVIVCFDGFVANGKTGTLGMAVTGVNGYVGPHLAKVRVRQSQHCSDLLCLAHLGSRFSSEVVRHAEGVTARSGRRGVRYFDVYLDPDLKVQEVQAASLRDKIHKTQMLKANLKRLNVLLQEKRSALITAAVTGQIDIPE